MSDSTNNKINTFIVGMHLSKLQYCRTNYFLFISLLLLIYILLYLLLIDWYCWLFITFFLFSIVLILLLKVLNIVIFIIDVSWNLLFLWVTVDKNTNIAFLTFSQQIVFTYFLFVSITFLKIDIAMVISACWSQWALSSLIQQTWISSF
jgi:hypothetical protein